MDNKRPVGVIISAQLECQYAPGWCANSEVTLAKIQEQRLEELDEKVDVYGKFSWF